jgi:hypothetical protein
MAHTRSRFGRRFQRRERAEPGDPAHRRPRLRRRTILAVACSNLGVASLNIGLGGEYAAASDHYRLHLTTLFDLAVHRHFHCDTLAVVASARVGGRWVGTLVMPQVAKPRTCCQYEFRRALAGDVARVHVHIG